MKQTLAAGQVSATPEVHGDELLAIFEEELAHDAVLPDQVKKLVIERACTLKVRRHNDNRNDSTD